MQIVKKGSQKRRGLWGNKEFPQQIVKKDDIYLVDNMWCLPTNNPFLVERALDRVKSSLFPPPCEKLSINERFVHIIQNSHTVIDIGATTGEYTIGAAMRAKKVLAIEASPTKFECLQKNMEKFSNVETFHCLLSDKPKTLTLYDDDDRVFGGSVIPGDSVQNKFTMDATTLDQLVGETSPDVLKITVNGHELEILQGGIETLKKTKHIVFQSANYEKILEFLSDYGFKVVESVDSCYHSLLSKYTRIFHLSN